MGSACCLCRNPPTRPAQRAPFTAVLQGVGLRPTGGGFTPQTARLTHPTFKAYGEGACEFIDVVRSTFNRWAKVVVNLVHASASFSNRPRQIATNGPQSARCGLECLQIAVSGPGIGRRVQRGHVDALQQLGQEDAGGTAVEVLERGVPRATVPERTPGTAGYGRGPHPI